MRGRFSSGGGISAGEKAQKKRPFASWSREPTDEMDVDAVRREASVLRRLEGNF
jgi:hypothetical protein